MRYLKALFTAIFAVSLIVTASPAQGAALPAPVACPGCWHPALQTSWQWQLSSLPARLDMCKAKGFDAVEPDNVDGYTNTTGFPLTKAGPGRLPRGLPRRLNHPGWALIRAHPQGATH
jgi:hypothetical protein